MMERKMENEVMWKIKNKSTDIQVKISLQLYLAVCRGKDCEGMLVHCYFFLRFVYLFTLYLKNIL